MNAKLTPRSNLAARIVDYSDRYLRIREIADWPNALNGLQLQNSGRVKRIGAAVDASTRVLTAAAKQRVDFLLVHHGLFWAGLGAVTGALHRQLEIAFSHDIAVYSAHLPLDVHPVVGNNTRLCAALGMRSAKPFLQIKGNPAGLRARSALSLAALATKLSASVNGP